MINLLLAFACTGERPHEPATHPPSTQGERGPTLQQPGTVQEPPATQQPSTPSTGMTGTTGQVPGTQPQGQVGQMRVFEDLDLDKDGSVEKDEVREVADLSRDFSTYDVDKDGMLSRTEFLSWQDAVVTPAFVDLDLNKDGVLESSEIDKDEVIKRDLTVIDTSKDGKISKEEYQVWISKTGRG